MASVIHAPFVDIITYSLGCTQFQGADRKDTRTCAAIQHATFGQFQQLGANHTCGFVGTCTKGQLGIDFDLYLTIYLGQMATVVNHQLVGNHDGLKTLLFPLLVPVAILGLAYIIYNRGTLEREILDTLAQCIFIEERLLHITLQACFGFLESFETSLASKRSKQVGSIGRIG